ncbi:MAG: hypothetical protein ACREE6_13225, partial [Limisphaerales bacterium]
DRIDILILDNLSCLFRGLGENDANGWERVLPWLLDLRRNRIAVIFLAHAGRNGQMRGTSRREDAAVWIIDLTEVQEMGEEREGARFVARFAKNRNTSEADCPPVEWNFAKRPGEGRARVRWTRVSASERFRKAIEEGLSTATDIAREMSVSRGQVSKYAAKGMKEGWLKRDGRGYALAQGSSRTIDRIFEGERPAAVRGPIGNG